MTGLRPGWLSLARVHIVTHTTSASGPARVDAYEAIPLISALASVSSSPLLVRGVDGASLLLSSVDVQDAYLTPLPESSGWQLVLLQDTTRRRRLKNPQSFTFQ